MSLATRIAAVVTAIGADIKALLARALPAGGATGTVLMKSAAGDYAVAWGAPTAAPAGSSNAVQYNNAGTMAGASNVNIDNGDLCLVVDPTPVKPGADNVKLFGKKLASRIFPAALGPTGAEYCLQPAQFRQALATWKPPGNSTTVPAVDGFNVVSSLGTVTARNVATTNLLTRTRRLAYASAATAGALAGHYHSTAQWTTGDGAGLGGFFYACRYAFTDPATVAGVRAFVGIHVGIAAPTNVEPNTLVNAIGLAQLSTDATQLYLVYGGSAAQAAIPLGTNFPPMAGIGATLGTVYDLTLFSPPFVNGVVYYRVERVGTAFIAEGTLTPTVVGTQTPASTVLMTHRAWRCNNATLLAVGIDIINVYIETDY